MFLYTVGVLAAWTAGVLADDGMYGYYSFQQQVVNDAVRNVRTALENYDVMNLIQQTEDAFEGINTVVEVFRDGLASRRTQAPPPIPTHTGLDMDCSNKLCKYMQYELSCKGIGIDMTKICSSYLVGTMYNCNEYPTGEYEVFNAPSVCLQQYIQFMQMLMGSATGSNPQPMQSVIQGYLFNPDFANDTCSRRCYQRFQNYSNEFLLDCQSQLDTYKANYPLVYSYSHYQQFRNQVCNVNATGANCYQSFSTMASSGGSSPVTPFNMQCNYVNNPTNNRNVLNNFCRSFSGFGCCAASGMQIIFANQMNTSHLNIWPPCFLNYLREQCPGVDLRDYCSTGSVAGQAIYHGSFVIPSTATNYVNVYNTTSVVHAQGILTGMFAGANPVLAQQPFNLNSGYPFAISITGYAYYNDSGMTTPANGVPAWPPESDYTSSTYGNFSYQVYMQNLSPTQVATFQTMVANPNLYNLVAMAFGANVAQTHTAASQYSSLGSDPLEVKSAAASRWMGSTTALALLVSAMVYVLGFRQ